MKNKHLRGVFVLDIVACVIVCSAHRPLLLSLGKTIAMLTRLACMAAFPPRELGAELLSGCVMIILLCNFEGRPGG